MGDTSSPAEPASKKSRIEEPSPSKLEKAQADYDQALGAYNRAEERLGKAFEDGVKGERLQFLKNALANAEKDKDRAWQTVELERKQTSQSEASEVAKKCLLFQF